jgi:hypothetical protein
MFVAVPTGTVATYGFLFVRQSAAAARSYEQARLATFDFLIHRRADVPGLSRYATATDHWEVFVALALQSSTLLAAAIEQRGKLFTKGENSVLERLHHLHSDAKHADSRIQNGSSSAEAGFTVWMADEGLHSKKHFVSWKEAASIVDDLVANVKILLSATPYQPST